jgi:hypothetical protein
LINKKIQNQVFQDYCQRCKNSNAIQTEIINQYNGINSVDGLVYFYEENYDNEQFYIESLDMLLKRLASVKIVCLCQ